MFKASKVLNKKEAQPVKPITNPTYDDTEIGQYFDSIFHKGEQPPEKLSPLILKTLFGTTNYRAQAKELFKDVKNSKAVCAKILTSKDIVFKCLDCEKDPTCIICKECYEKGNHKGHRVILQKNGSGCCDCGDPDAWKEEGFCSDHPGYAKFKPTYSVDDIPEDFRNTFLSLYEKCFYYWFTFLDEVGIQRKKQTFLYEKAALVLKELLSSLDFCGEQSMALYLLVCKLFSQRLSDHNRLLYIKSSNLKSLEFNKEPEKCEFTYLECLFAYAQLLDGNSQKQIEELTIKLFLDYDFKKYQAETFVKMINFIYYADESPEDGKISYSSTKINSLNVQLFTAEEFSIIAINSPHFSLFLELFEKILRRALDDFNQHLFYTWIEYEYFLYYAVQKKPSRERLVQHEEFMIKILEWLDILNYSYQIDVTKKKPITPTIIEEKLDFIEFDYKLLQLVDHLFIELASLSNGPVKDQIIKNVGQTFLRIISNNAKLYAKNKAVVDKYRTYHVPFYRAFALFIKSQIPNPDYESVRVFLTETLNLDAENLKLVTSTCFDIVIRVYGFIKDNEKRAWDISSPLFDTYVALYKNPKFKNFDADLFLLQTMTLFIDKADLCRIIAERLSLNPHIIKLLSSIESGKFNQKKFSEAIDSITKLGKEQTKVLSLIDEVFSFFILLSIDEAAYANLCYQKDKLFEYRKNPEYCNRVYQDILINLFQKQNKMDLKTIIECLSTKTVVEKADLETPLSKIAVFSQQTKTFTLKPEYVNVYEPFIFVRDTKLQVDTHDVIKNKLKSNKENLDFIAGNHSHVYEYNSSLHQKVQESLFQGPFIEFAVNLVATGVQKFKEHGLFVRPVLKFIHMAISYSLRFENIEFTKSLSQLFDSQEFAEALKTLKNDHTIEDSHNGIDKIIQAITKIQNKDKGNEEVMMTEEVNELELKKKKSKEEIAQRMLDLKKQFSQKQEAFLKKYKYEMEQANKDSNTADTHICNICHSEINPEKDKYGVPAYLGSSTVYNLGVFQTKSQAILTQQNLKSRDVLFNRLIEVESNIESLNKAYPTITSCGHFIHLECFEKHSRKKQDTQTDFLYNHELEYACSFCKSLSNVFIRERLEAASPEEEKEEISLELTSIQPTRKFLASLNPRKIKTGIEIDSIFSDALVIEIMKNREKDIANISEDFNLDLFDDLLGQAYKSVSLVGISHFIKKNLNLMRSIKNSYIEFYKTHESSTKLQHFNSLKNLLIDYLDALTLGLPNELEKKNETVLYEDSPAKTALNCNPDNFFFNALQHIVVASELNCSTLNDLVKWMLRFYLCHRLVQIYVKKRISKGELDQVSIQDFSNILNLDANSMIKEELCNGLLPSMRKLIAFVLVNLPFEKEQVEKIEKEDFMSDQEELDCYLSMSPFNTNSKELLSEKLFEYSGIPKESVEIWLNHIGKENTSDGTDLNSSIFISDQEITFNFVSVPENYFELSTTYIERNCQICKDHPQFGNKCLCLLCQMVLCSSACKTNKRCYDNNQGNLNVHSTKYHGGVGCFLNTETGKLYLINTPKNIEYAPLYVDKFGYSLEEKRRDWKEYTVDKSLLSNLREKFLLDKVPQELTYQIMNKGKKLYDNVL